MLLIAPLLADGQSRKSRDNDNRGIEVTFTKWITTFPAMEGFVGGDANGDFVGEVFQATTSANRRITRLEAMYEVRAGARSFTAVGHGGQNNVTNTAILDVSSSMDGASAGSSMWNSKLRPTA